MQTSLDLIESLEVLAFILNYVLYDDNSKYALLYR